MKRKADSDLNTEKMAKKAKAKESNKDAKVETKAKMTKPKQNADSHTETTKSEAAAASLNTSTDDMDLRYGTLLVGSNKKQKKKGPQLKHLLEKADANKQRLEELKKEDKEAANKEMMKRAILQVGGLTAFLLLR